MTRELEAKQQIADEADKARLKALMESLDAIEFDDIMGDPDNIQLNYVYAQKQIRDGNMLGAAGTLERILMINPDLIQIKMLYAIVLFRLDNALEAQRELQSILEMDIPEDLKQEASHYLKKLQFQNRRTRFSLSQSLGYGFDTNRNAAPSSKRILFFEAPVGLTGTERKTRDTSFMNISRLSFEHDIGFGTPHQLIGSFTYYLQEQTAVDNLDLQSFEYDVGTVIHTKHFQLTPVFFANNVFLSREQYLRTQGGSVRVDRPISNKLGVHAATSLQRLDFLPITENTSAPERKGRQLDVEVGFSYKLISSLQWSSSLGYTNKSAEEDYNAYDGLTVKNNMTLLMGGGQFLINSLDLGREMYDELELAVAPRRRRENQLRYRVTYGAPLESLLIGKVLPSPLKDITFTFTYEYYRALSNITNYTYRNNKFQAMLTKKWEF